MTPEPELLQETQPQQDNGGQQAADAPTPDNASSPHTLSGEESNVKTDTDAAFLGFIFMGAIVYFTLVWGRLPEGNSRWLVTGAAVVGIAAIWLAVRKWDWLRKGLLRWGGVATDMSMFIGIVVVILLASVWLEPQDQIVLLKAFAVLYFSILPALLYLQFSSGKTLTVLKEFVLNLHKLKADDPSNLPRPPTLSRFYEPWEEARREAFPGTLDDDAARRIEWANIYRVKFRDLFGPVPDVQQQQLSVLSLRSVHKLQVAITTILVTIGWIFVVQPEAVFGRSVLPADFEPLNLPAIPREAFSFAFLGAYFYILQMLVRRYFQNDLKATAYINATMRIVVVILIVWTIDPLLQDSTTQAQRNAIAFVIGVFPTVGWQLLVQLLIRVPGVLIESLRPTYKLTDLDGLSVWYESRLLEVGVEDMQNLATTDIPDLMLNTRIPVDRLVDWIDQAFLYVRITDKDERTTLREYGLRTATDLLDVYTAMPTEMEWLLNKESEGPSRMRSLVESLKRERNLQHVQAWRSFEVKPATVEPAPAGSAPAPG